MRCQVPSVVCGGAAEATDANGGTHKMADATCTLDYHREASTILHHLETVFDAFWRKLRRKQTLTEVIKSPHRLSRRPPCHSSSKAQHACGSGGLIDMPRRRQCADQPHH
ncbi:Hypothetical predicted protein [Pelobates cultripes]|uniref:Uncharacterized protein n=1 Tax=Pelobates cultripes TaxID=61616 RepID=A0AAD1WBQ8_PELCU|nr:Hypothetical predicted protein [Pelobates cultripes]